MVPPAYEVFEELGRGENTIVHRGYDLTLGRDVAVKELNEISRKDPRRVEQFVKDARFLAQFDHENILRIHNVDQTRGWIVMELMKGTLASQVAEESMSADTVRSVMRQILGALEFLHQKNKIHGAVRASNILINDVGTVKLSDFEAAEIGNELRVPTGSKKHLAPELIRPQFGTLGPTTDLYCLGFTALELLAGPKFTSFFSGTGSEAIDDDVAWLRWHSSDEPLTHVNQLIPDVPDDLANVIDQLLSKNAADRPQSAAAVLDQLSEQAFIPVVAKDAISSVSPALVTTPPDAQTRNTEAAKSTPQMPRKTKPAQGTQHPAKKSKLNNFLEKPYVLWPLCAFLLIGALFIGLEFQGRSVEPVIEDVPLAQVRVVVDPPNASITLGEMEFNPSDEGLLTKDPGAYELRVEKEGYETHTQSLELLPGLNEFSISLQAIERLARVRIVVTPDSDDAEILFGSEQEPPDSEGFYTLAPGDYGLRVVKQGYAPYENRVSVTTETSELLVALSAIEPAAQKPTEPIPHLGQLRLNISPDGDGTRILFDGTRYWSNCDGIIELKPKSYNFTVVRNGFEKYSDTVVVPAGTSELNIELVKKEIALLKVNVSTELGKAVAGELRLGDPAPPLSIKEWIKGSSGNDLTPGKVNVVEFWASWCPPCLPAMMHLSEQKHKYGDALNIVGITSEDAEEILEFMETDAAPDQTWRETISYAIAIDRKRNGTNRQSTTHDYMTASGQEGIPCAFIVGKDGKVEWIGHTAKIDKPLAKIFDGTWIRQRDRLAKVSIDGQQIEPNADGLYEVEPGTHKVKVSLEGFDTCARTVPLTVGDNEVSFSLTAAITQMGQLEQEFAAAYESKTTRPEYVAWRSKRVNKPEPFSEEKTVKRIRSEMTALVKIPRGVTPIEIPTDALAKPVIDGTVKFDEVGDGWSKARRVNLRDWRISEDNDESSNPNKLYVIASKTKLYIGIDAISDTTPDDNDYVFCSFHHGTTRLLRFERIKVFGDSRQYNRRVTKIPFQVPPATVDIEPWMNRGISEWAIYQQAIGKSSMSRSGLASSKQHRHYELELDLAESGIHPGIPFRAKIVVIDYSPSTKERNAIGGLGAGQHGQWFIVKP